MKTHKFLNASLIVFATMVIITFLTCQLTNAEPTPKPQPCPPCDSCCPDCPPCPECPDPPPCPDCPPDKLCPPPPKCDDAKCPKCPKCPKVGGDLVCCETNIALYLDGTYQDTWLWCNIPRVGEQILFHDNSLEATVIKVIWESNPHNANVYCEAGVLASLAYKGETLAAGLDGCFIEAVK